MQGSKHQAVRSPGRSELIWKVLAEGFGGAANIEPPTDPRMRRLARAAGGRDLRAEASLLHRGYTFRDERPKARPGTRQVLIAQLLAQTHFVRYCRIAA